MIRKVKGEIVISRKTGVKVKGPLPSQRSGIVVVSLRDGTHIRCLRWKRCGHPALKPCLEKGGKIFLRSPLRVCGAPCFEHDVAAGTGWTPRTGKTYLCFAQNHRKRWRGRVECFLACPRPYGSGITRRVELLPPSPSRRSKVEYVR